MQGILPFEVTWLHSVGEPEKSSPPVSMLLEPLASTAAALKELVASVQSLHVLALNPPTELHPVARRWREPGWKNPDTPPLYAEMSAVQKSAKLSATFKPLYMRTS